MISVKGASFGRYRWLASGGADCRIFLTVSLIPHCHGLPPSRWTLESDESVIRQASRTRRYRSTVYILPPSISKKIEGYRWQSFTPPAAGKSRRFRGLICHRRSHDEIERRGIGVDRIDPAGLDLPPPGADPDSSDAVALKAMVSRATGIVFSTPEYHGSFSSVTKLIIENLGFPSVLATKPVALIGVAAGQIGAIKALEHLRSVLSHVGAIVLPGPVSVPRVRAVFADDGQCRDQVIEALLRGVAGNLIDYITGSVCPRSALEQLVREKLAEAAA